MVVLVKLLQGTQDTSHELSPLFETLDRYVYFAVGNCVLNPNEGVIWNEH